MTTLPVSSQASPSAAMRADNLESGALRTLLERWFSAWVARSEARWATVELRHRYY